MFSLNERPRRRCRMKEGGPTLRICSPGVKFQHGGVNRVNTLCTGLVGERCIWGMWGCQIHTPWLSFAQMKLDSLLMKCILSCCRSSLPKPSLVKTIKKKILNQQTWGVCQRADHLHREREKKVVVFYQAERLFFLDTLSISIKWFIEWDYVWFKIRK